MKLMSEISEYMKSFEGLEEPTLSEFLKKHGFSEDGFEFVAIKDSRLVFAVPKQDPARWYGDDLWPSAEKREIAENIAKKYNIEVCTPPDDSRGVGIIGKQSIHHLEFYGKSPGRNFNNELFAAAHPRYLKIIRPDVNSGLNVPEFFEDIRSLYL